MTDAKYQMTRETLEQLEAELHQLENEERRAIAERIRIAREWGDLKENAEYHDAKNSQAHLETKILRLRDRTRNAVVVESAAGATSAGLGSTVTVEDEAAPGKPRTYELVTPTDSDPAAGKLSVDSPLGSALLGAEVGKTVTYDAPKGPRRLKVLSLQ
jgi:transcription elongation factor GreA